MKAGLNLYSLRTFIKTEEEFLDTAKKIKAMGYDYAQFCAQLNEEWANIIARVVAQADLPIFLTHCPWDRVLNDTEKLMEEHAKFGCKNIGIGGLPNPVVVDEKQCKQTYDALNL
ncbi:MAG: hypothetical protein IJA89_07095, partial [Clostridia bacterium]|nr:hypothetical protein [Clostridia bacterium]